jgi:hypothetical protein
MFMPSLDLPMTALIAVVALFLAFELFLATFWKGSEQPSWVRAYKKMQMGRNPLIGFVFRVGLVLLLAAIFRAANTSSILQA